MLHPQYDTHIKSYKAVHRFSNIIDLIIAEAFINEKKHYAYHQCKILRNVYHSESV